MTKAEYIIFKKSNSFTIVYEYYLENFNSDKHKPFLSFNNFFTYISIWTRTHMIDLNLIFEKVCDKYDKKYNIIKLLDNQGVLISYL
jgi:hypothetical protein